MRSAGLSTILATALIAGAAGACLAWWALPRAPIPPPADTRETGRWPSFAEAVARAAPAVVSIYATREPEPSPARADARPATGLGSGVVLSADGVILTNRHVVQSAARIRAVLADGRSLDATLLGLDPDTDLAVLKAQSSGLPSAPVGDPRALRVGDVALAIGNPYGIGQTVTQGIVSATGRVELGLTPIENYIQTDAAINPGNSGGALVNARGELVGINTAIYAQSGASGGIGFAIPADLALKVAGAIVARGRVERGWLGLSGRSLSPGLRERFGLRAPAGVLVSAILPDSPAEQAGLRPGDVVTRVGDRPVLSVQELLDAVAGAGPRQPLALELWRGSERLTANALTQARPGSDR